MRGRITTAVRVRGERRGQRITRIWVFIGHSCGARFCGALTLVRQRGQGSANSTITLRHLSGGSYGGQGSFRSGLRCLGRSYPRGLLVPYRITVRVLQSAEVQGIMFARRISASYVNRRRIDQTKCPLGPSHDAARYIGVTVVPGPPRASFTARAGLLSDVASFTDTSAPGPGEEPIVAVDWNFGDPASGAADRSTAPSPTHAFSRPGSYLVTLTVVDAYGLRASVSQAVTVTGLPAAALRGSPDQPAQRAKRTCRRTAESSAASLSGRRRTGRITAYRQHGRPDSVKKRCRPSCPGRVTCSRAGLNCTARSRG
jgi:hypothetical protein